MRANLTVCIYILVMAAVTYLIRMTPFVLFRKKIKSRFIRSLLYYLPYAVLSAMVIPSVFYRLINPHDDIDIKKYLEIRYELDNFLKKKFNPLTEEQIKWLRIRMGGNRIFAKTPTEWRICFRTNKETRRDMLCM